MRQAMLLAHAKSDATSDNKYIGADQHHIQQSDDDKKKQREKKLIGADGLCECCDAISDDEKKTSAPTNITCHTATMTTKKQRNKKESAPIVYAMRKDKRERCNQY